jgi:hypothetical protein
MLVSSMERLGRMKQRRTALSRRRAAWEKEEADGTGVWTNEAISGSSGGTSKGAVEAAACGWDGAAAGSGGGAEAGASWGGRRRCGEGEETGRAAGGGGGAAAEAGAGEGREAEDDATGGKKVLKICGSKVREESE